MYPFALLPNTFNSIAANMANAVWQSSLWDPHFRTQMKGSTGMAAYGPGGNAYKKELARTEGLDSPTAPRAQINLSKNDPVKSSA